MAEQNPLTDQNTSLTENAPIESEGTDELTETDLLEDELEELVI